MNLPKSIKVLGITYKVTSPEEYLAMMGRWGETHNLTGEIRVAVEHGRNDRIRETLLHEIFHAIIAEILSTGDFPEERIVESLASGLWAVFRDNPSLLTYLKEYKND